MGLGEIYYDQKVARCTSCCGFIRVGGADRRRLEVASGLATIVMYSLGRQHSIFSSTGDSTYSKQSHTTQILACENQFKVVSGN